MVHTVVVVTGTVVGTVVLGVVGVVTGFVVVVVPDESSDSEEVVVDGVVVEGVSSDVVEVLFVVEGTVVDVAATGFAAPAR